MRILNLDKVDEDGFVPVDPGPLVIGQIVWDRSNGHGYGLIIEDGESAIMSSHQTSLDEITDWLNDEMNARR